MIAHGTEAHAALAEAAAFRTISLLLSRPRPDWDEEVRSAARETPDALLREAAAAAAGAGEGPYHALLGAGGPASPREAANGRFADPGRTLADLAAVYSAFAYAPDGEEPADHLAVECDFASWLLVKEAYARASGLDEAAAVTRAARIGFVERHMAPAGRRFAAGLPRWTPRYLALAAEALVARLPPVPLDAVRPPCEDGELDCAGCG